MNLPAGEPKDGDFVAYLAQIERQQLSHLSPPTAPLPAAAKEAAPTRTMTPTPKQPAKGIPPAAVGGLVLGAIGLFLLMLGLFGDGGWIAAAIGAFLLWHAAKALSSAARGQSQDARALLAAKFPPAGKHE